MATATLPPQATARTPPPRVVGITVDQYAFLIRSGRLAETAATELIDGQIVRTDRSCRGGDPMAIGEGHARVVTKGGDLAVDLLGTGASVRCQQPIVIPPRHMPEPDIAIVRGTDDDCFRAHPRLADVLCAIEVADSSLDEDRTDKRRLYAEAGIPLYLIVNIPDRRVEWHENGTHAVVRVLRPGEAVDLPVGEGRTIRISADRLIPPAASATGGR